MRSGHLPKRVPVGTKYVIEGKSLGPGDEMEVFSRYVVFPDGRCLDLAPDIQEFALRASPAINQTKH